MSLISLYGHMTIHLRGNQIALCSRIKIYLKYILRQLHVVNYPTLVLHNVVYPGALRLHGEDLQDFSIKNTKYK